MSAFVSIVVASCGRPQMFDLMLTSLRETTQAFEVEVIAVVDQDKETCEIAISHDVDVLDYSPTRRGALFCWNRGLSHSDGEIIVPAGDDQIFHSGWLEYALSSHRSKLGGYGVVGMNDLAYDGNLQLATVLMFDRQYCKDHMGGVICPPVYSYYCVDSEINAKAKSLGRFYWEERAKVEHLHSAHGKRPVDDTDRLKDEAWMAIDNKTFEERKTQGFPVTWLPVI